jgi:hypothetical protein
MVAARKKVPEIFCYEISGSTNLRKEVNPFIPNIYINVSKEINKKLKALSFYKTEIKNFPNPIALESIRILSKFRGVESGLMAAEAFVCIKMIK